MKSYKWSRGVILLIACLHCATMSDDFESDFLRPSQNWQFTYDANFKVTPGKTTAGDLNSVYPHGPRLRISFPGGLKRMHEGRQIFIDEIWVYGEAKNEIRTLRLPNGQSVVQDITLQTLTFAVFLYQEVVTGYSVRHQIRDDGNSDFRSGPFNTQVTDPGDVYPGSRSDMRAYAKLRGREWSCKHGFYDICDGDKKAIPTKEGKSLTRLEKMQLEDTFHINADSVVMVESFKGTRNRDGARFLTREYYDNRTGMGYRLKWLLKENDKVDKFCGYSDAIGPCAIKSQ